MKDDLSRFQIVIARTLLEFYRKIIHEAQELYYILM
jgi:hypothetical protein